MNDPFNTEWAFKIPVEALQRTVPITSRQIMLNENVGCSISGGSDSDDMLDIVSRLDIDKKVKYVFFDTGMEMQATKKHLQYLEDKYGITIERVRPKLPVAIAVRKIGYPFLSKKISDNIGRLQNHGFKWEDESYEVLNERYPGCQTALRWWCNDWGEGSSFNIEKNFVLKEFIMQNPPNFRISNKCCKCSKKDPANRFVKDNCIDLQIIGIRRAEGGVRATAYKSCMSDGIHGLQHFPLFWFTDQDKAIYEKAMNIRHSDAYEVYGCTRTGCAGCPFGSHFEEELKMLEEFEPKLYKAVCNIFAPSYEYTRKYREFKAKIKAESKTAQLEGQTVMEGF